MVDRHTRRSKIAVVTSNFWPEPTGTSQTVSEFAEFVSEAGLSVNVATAMPYYPQWQIWLDYQGRLWSTERRARVTIHRSWHYVSPRPSTLTRLLHEATLSLFAIPNVLRVLWKADVAYIVSPALSYAFMAMILARALGVRRVLVVKDVMPDAAVELGMLKNVFIIGLSRFLARCVYDWADEIHTLGEGMRRRIAHDTMTPRKIRIVPDTIDPSELAPVEPDANEFRKRFVPPGTFAIVHAGNMGKKQDLQVLARAARRLRHEREIHFYVFGDGATKDEFLRTCREWDLENVSHYRLQERWMLSHMLSGADVVLVSQLPEVVDLVVPSKLITALGAGAMIVAACAPESETASLLRDSEGGVWIPASDDQALVRAITRIRAGEVNVASCRRRAREFALRVFDRSAVYGSIVGEFQVASESAWRACDRRTEVT
jgi:colanic acid biosynthesis glycosyl transferase WcaI